MPELAFRKLKEIDKRDINFSKCAVILCDVWDKHWCRGANERAEKIIPRIDNFINVLRKLGFLVCHSPAEVIEYYEGNLARKRAKEAPFRKVSLKKFPKNVPKFSYINSWCDTDKNPGKYNQKMWTKQHSGISINQELDIIAVDPVEICNVFSARSIELIFFCGFHTNVCLLYRPFGIIKMSRRGYDVCLVRDLTDSMWNPKRSPFLSHDEGTRLVVEYIEKYWCPTILSTDVMSFGGV